jgi:catechol 2,3-dioxygenase-like lactoylglutathione lyase family enzyme
MTSATVRYFVTDLDPAVAFYRDLLGFEVELRPSPTFAMLYRGDLRLLLSVPGGGGGASPLANGDMPQPGGWNRFAIQVPDLEKAVAELGDKGATFRGAIVTGVGVKQAILEDPDRNPIELFEPLEAYHERAPKESGRGPA